MAFDVSGRWQAKQTNGPLVTFDMQQDGETLHGTAAFDGNSGTGRGRVAGNGFLFTVDWNGPSVGEYNGTFGLDGRLTGHTFDLSDPASQAGWVSLREFGEA
jgi:hypothetical protein